MFALIKHLFIFYSTSMKAKIKIPTNEVKKQIIGVRLNNTEILKVKIFCRKNHISQSNLIRYAINDFIPGLLN
jgi:hypothetical protein